MSSYRMVMLTYPRPYRRAHGPEIVDTANELADGRWSARQAGALAVEGLRTRTRLSTGGSARQAWASGLALAVALTALLSLAAMITNGSADILGSGEGLRALALVLVPLVALTVTTRWPAVLFVSLPLGFALVHARNDDYSGSWSWQSIVLGQGPAVVLAAVVAFMGDGRRAVSPGWALGLVGLIVGAGWVVSPLAVFEATAFTVLLLLPVVGIAAVPVDPRPLAAGSAIGLIWAGNAASPLLVPGLYDIGTYVMQLTIVSALALLGLAIAAVAGRRTLSVSR